MITAVQSAILVEVPEAEPLVGALRAVGDPSAAAGMPAHVTLLQPFVEDPDEGIVEELRFFFAGVDGFRLRFTSVAELAQAVCLVPEPGDVVRGLVEALARRWPDCPPPDDVVPHLTVVDTPDAALRLRARAEVAGGLPVTTDVHQAALWVRDGDRWSRRAAFPLGEPE